MEAPLWEIYKPSCLCKLFSSFVSGKQFNVSVAVQTPNREACSLSDLPAQFLEHLLGMHSCFS